MAMITETQIRGEICDLLERIGLIYSITDSSQGRNRYGRSARSKARKGWPDISLVLPPDGRAGFFEVKTPLGKLRPDQEAMIAQLRDAGAWVAVVKSVADVCFELAGWLPDGRLRRNFLRMYPQSDKEIA